MARPQPQSSEDRRARIARAFDFLRSRALAYRRTFKLSGGDAELVLADLARFCRANVSTGHANSHVAARLDGRREVWLRIQQHLSLSNEALWQLYGGPKVEDEPNND